MNLQSQTILNHELKDKNLTGKNKMIIPIRCMSCGKPIGHLWEEFSKRVKEGEDKKKVMDDLGLKRFCCRAIFVGHVDLIDEIAQFKKS